MKDTLKQRYFKWLLSKVDGGSLTRYSKLMNYLHEKPFIFSMPIDVNRKNDGIELRYTFGYENSISEGLINRYLMDRDCTTLEMMVALAVRCEENITWDDEEGDPHYSHWFSIMLDSTGFSRLPDEEWDEAYADWILDRLETRCYSAEGNGGLFYIPHTKLDLRKVEIWYQLHEYLLNS